MALVPRVHLTKLAQFLGQESVQKRLTTCSFGKRTFSGLTCKSTSGLTEISPLKGRVESVLYDLTGQIVRG